MASSCPNAAGIYVELAVQSANVSEHCAMLVVVTSGNHGGLLLFLELKVSSCLTIAGNSACVLMFPADLSEERMDLPAVAHSKWGE